MDQSAEHALDFATYVAERRASLLRAARAISGDPDLAEDLLHTALARVLPHWSTLRDQGAADAYVRRAMVNQHLTWCRQRSRHPERVTDQVPEPRGGGFETSVRDELGLWPMVTALPRRQRSAVVLRYYEGLSVQETSQVLRCSTGTVKSTTHRGLATLRRRAVEAGLAAAG